MEVRDIKTAETLSATLNEAPLVVLDFHAPWCGPCKVAMPHYLRMSRQFPHVIFVKMNLDEIDQRIADIFEAQSLPLFLVIHNNQVVRRFEGYDPSSTLQSIASTLTALTPMGITSGGDPGVGVM